MSKRPPRDTRSESEAHNGIRVGLQIEEDRKRPNSLNETLEQIARHGTRTKPSP
jgi:hypothetical protein